METSMRFLVASVNNRGVTLELNVTMTASGTYPVWLATGIRGPNVSGGIYSMPAASHFILYIADQESDAGAKLGPCGGVLARP